MAHGTILRICDRGILRVYKREAWAKIEGLPRYFVLNTVTNRTLEEFRRKQSAIKWAEDNQHA